VYATIEVVVGLFVVWWLPVLASLTSSQWSALGSMLGGLGSIAAVVGAAALILVEVRARRVEARRYAAERREQAAERRQIEARRRDDEARQARLIMAETGRAIESPEAPGRGTMFLYIDVTNHSDAFVLDVVVRIPGEEQRKLVHYIKPGTTESAEFRHIPNDYYVQHVGCGGPFSPYQLRVTLEFTDASGRRWRRTGWEQPQQLPMVLADPSLYLSLPPVPLEEHPYDEALNEARTA
jgi:hypothetical protein